MLVNKVARVRAGVSVVPDGHSFRQDQSHNLSILFADLCGSSFV